MLLYTLSQTYFHDDGDDRGDHDCNRKISKLYTESVHRLTLTFKLEVVILTNPFFPKFLL